MKLKKQIILIAAICMLFGVAGYSLNNQKASADTDNDIEVQTEKPSETENPENTASPEPTAEPENTTLPPLVSYAKTKKKITLKYDDRHTFNKEIRRIATENVVSTNATTGQKDRKIVSVANSNHKKIFAVGCGKAVVELKDGTTYGVLVRPAKISLLLLIGQSNMEGSHSDDKTNAEYTNNAILNSAGKVYNTYGPSCRSHYKRVANWSKTSPALSVANASKFVPKSLTDNSSDYEWCRTNNLTSASGAKAKSGIDSALANQWTNKLKEKVWVVNAAHGGSSITTWQPKAGKDNNFWQAVALYKACERTLNNEIKAGHYKLSHKGYFWLQGEQDFKMKAGKYLTYYMKMHRALKKQLKGNSAKDYKYVNKKLEFGGILMVRSHRKPTSLADLELTGPRKAQYYMCNSGKAAYKDIFLASQLSEVWLTDNTVKSYFKNKYKTNAKYTSYNKTRSKSLKLPTSLNQIHSTIHYTQLAYNELGRDAANNICYVLGYVKKPSTKVKIKLVSQDGYTDISKINRTAVKNMNVVAKIFPTWKTKKLKVNAKSGAISYDKWLVKFKENQVFNAKLQFTVGSRKKKLTVYSKNSMAAITGLQATMDGVKISWMANSYTSYCNVYRRVKGTKTWTYIAMLNTNTAQSYNDIFANSGTTYEYAVTAYDSKGNCGEKVVGEVTTLF